MSFDPSNCNLAVTPFPSEHLLTDSSVPDPLTGINDCSAFDIPQLFPEGPCPTIISTASVVHFSQVGDTELPERVSVQQATEECVFNTQFNLNPPCLIVEAGGQFNYVPFSEGVDARLTFKTAKDDTDSATVHDHCYLGLFLDIDIPSQACPTVVSGTNDITVLPPGEAASLTVTVTQTDESEDTSCAFRVDLDLQVPCTGVEVSGSSVEFDSGGGAPPNGYIRVVTLSAIPCQFDFQVLLDLSSVVFDPLTAPAITDFCVDSSGQLQSAEVTYYIWPAGTIDYTLWRSQFGYCDENDCFSTPLDFGLYNTGCNDSNQALGDTCQDDSHWQCDGSAAKSMASSAYPTVWLRPGRRSRWIAKTCAGIEASGEVQTFSTTFSIPGTISAADFALEGVLNADNWVTEIRVNGVPVPIQRLTDIYPGENDYELRGPMYRFLLKSNFVIGANTIEFDVNSSDIPDGDPSWLGFRVEWTGVGACNSRYTTTTSTTSTTPSPTSSTLPPTTPPPSSSTTSTTPGPDCACHIHLGDNLKVQVELQNSYLSTCYTSNLTAPTFNETGNIWYSSPYMCKIDAHAPPDHPNCGVRIFVSLFRSGGPPEDDKYTAQVMYCLYPYVGATSVPYFTAVWNLPVSCPSSCSPLKLEWPHTLYYGTPPTYTVFIGPSLIYCPNEIGASIVKFNYLLVTRL